MNKQYLSNDKHKQNISTLDTLKGCFLSSIIFFGIMSALFSPNNKKKEEVPPKQEIPRQEKREISPVKKVIPRQEKIKIPSKQEKLKKKLSDLERLEDSIKTQQLIQKYHIQDHGYEDPEVIEIIEELYVVKAVYLRELEEIKKSE